MVGCAGMRIRAFRVLRTRLVFLSTYSEQFENGLYSEASIGNVGKDPRPVGWTDNVMTPRGGLTMLVRDVAQPRIASANLRHV